MGRQKGGPVWLLGLSPVGGPVAPVVSSRLYDGGVRGPGSAERRVVDPRVGAAAVV